MYIYMCVCVKKSSIIVARAREDALYLMCNVNKKRYSIVKQISLAGSCALCDVKVREILSDMRRQ